MPSTKLSSSEQNRPSKLPPQKPNWDLVLAYLPLLKSIVKKMMLRFPNTLDHESIYTISLLGLITATQTFNEQKDTRFGTYASIRIKGALLDELRRLDWLPRHLRQKIKTFKRDIAQWEQKLGRSLSDEEICNYLHLDKAQLQKLKPYLKASVFISLEQVHSNGDQYHLSLMEMFHDPQQKNGRDLYEQKELEHLIEQQLDTLPEHIQRMFKLHYQQGIYWAEIARMFKISKSRVCQLHTKTLERIRKNLLGKINL
jgi:RNA polymerase sigma factor for flagellar operon FliA